MLAALTDALKHESNASYATALEQLLQFIKTYQTDASSGIWLYAVSADGKPTDTTRANSWKANYHDVRAMIKFEEALGSK